jgi:hypothetical protein
LLGGRCRSCSRLPQLSTSGLAGTPDAAEGGAAALTPVPHGSSSSGGRGHLPRPRPRVPSLVESNAPPHHHSVNHLIGARFLEDGIECARHRRDSPPAGSFPEGFRTTAPAPVAPPRWAVVRNPEHERSSDALVPMQSRFAVRCPESQAGDRGCDGGSS